MYTTALARLGAHRSAACAMTAPPYRVLFVCTGNSARSILSEAMLNHRGQGQFIAYSAGSHPTGRVNPYALRQLEEAGIPTAGLHSKSWDEFAGRQAPRLDVVVTVCDSAAQEVCPVFLGDFVRSHWGLPDPALTVGSPVQLRDAFAQAHAVIAHRIEKLLALPIATMDQKQLREQLDCIGKSLP